ncbi:MAG: hypothetical protein MJ156_01095 [Alphaproteobacteria bacterium]|nr:hypothetical protein [Alphaproteobacteria bacterium]
MNKVESLFNNRLMYAMAACVVAFSLSFFVNTKDESKLEVYNSNYGNFLAAQHAVYMNDFESASKLMSSVKSDKKSVVNTKILVDFLNGTIVSDAQKLKDDKSLSGRLIYDAYLVKEAKWQEVYNRHYKEDSALLAPLRIFSAVKVGKYKEAEKFIKDLKTTDSWKSFVRGQIAVLKGDIDKAAKEFANVHPDFMNVNDYLYLMSFYKEHGMDEDVDILRTDFMAKPSGMYVLNYNDIPDWKNYTGYENNLAFSVLQTVSHAQIMLYTDLSLMLLRFSQVIGPDIDVNAINYYLGLYLYRNHGDFEKCFNNIDNNSLLFLFGQFKSVESTNDINKLYNIVHKNPLFIPAENKLVLYYIQNGKKHAALKTVNNALRNKNLSDLGRQYFLKQRANIYLMFGDIKSAQRDVDYASENEFLDDDILVLQSRIWVAQKKNLEKAYKYAMSLVKKDTSDVLAWDILGTVVAETEGIDAALDVVERVGAISINTSSLFEHLGDLYIKKDDVQKAKAAYIRAIDLSDDGLVIVPKIQNKLRKIK